MVFREQTVNVGQSGGTVQMKFGDVTLELGYRQAEALCNELRLAARAGRRVYPPTLAIGDSVRCVYGRFSGQGGIVHSCSETGEEFAIEFNSGNIAAGYEACELELTPDE